MKDYRKVSQYEKRVQRLRRILKKNYQLRYIICCKYVYTNGVDFRKIVYSKTYRSRHIWETSPATMVTNDVR